MKRPLHSQLFILIQHVQIGATIAINERRPHALSKGA